jgi:hypothetical protein
MFRVTVSQYQGAFASAIAHRPGPNLKSGSQTAASTRRIFMLSHATHRPSSARCHAVMSYQSRPINTAPQAGDDPIGPLWLQKRHAARTKVTVALVL